MLSLREYPLSIKILIILCNRDVLKSAQAAMCPVSDVVFSLGVGSQLRTHTCRHAPPWEDVLGTWKAQWPSCPHAKNTRPSSTHYQSCSSSPVVRLALC